MSNTEDLKTLEGIASGNESIIIRFYKKNLPYIQGYILQNSGSKQDVEDVFQDALVFLYQKLKNDSLELSSSLSTYFYGVCKNIWRNRLRKNNRTVSKDTFLEANELEPEVLQQLENKEREFLYRKYFVKLSKTCKAVLTMVFEGKSMKEISGITGYSEAYSRKKKFDCKKSLIEMIEKDPLYKEL